MKLMSDSVTVFFFCWYFSNDPTILFCSWNSSDRLSLLLAKERSHTQTYIGCMKKGQVFANPKLKWLVLPIWSRDNFLNCARRTFPFLLPIVLMKREMTAIWCLWSNDQLKREIYSVNAPFLAEVTIFLFVHAVVFCFMFPMVLTKREMTAIWCFLLIE